MCRTHIVHFSHHDVRPYMTTSPFGLDGEGDFINPVTITLCSCTVKLKIPWPRPSNVPRPGMEPPVESFDHCPDHDCCAIWDHLVLCEWAHQSVMNGGPNQNPHLECPNFLMTHEYHPLQTAMAPHPKTGDWAEPAWREDGLPTFPVDMFYSHHVHGNNQDAHRIARDVADMFEMGYRMKASKRKVVEGLKDAENELASRLDEILDLGHQLEKLADFLKTVKKVLRRISGLLEMIHSTGGFLPEMLSRQHSALEFLNRLPEDGGVATSADGLYQVSRERLELAVEDKEAFIAEAEASNDWKSAMTLHSAFTEMRMKIQARLGEIDGGNVVTRKRGPQDGVYPGKRKRSSTTSSAWIGGWAGQVPET